MSHSVLVIVSSEDKAFTKPSLATISAAKQLGQVTALLMGYGEALYCEKLPEDVNCLVIDELYLQNLLAEDAAVLITELAQDYDYVLMPANTAGKNILPRVAALLDAPMVSDVIEILDGKTFSHPIYAGNVVETVQVNAKKICLSIRTTAFSPQSLDIKANIQKITMNQPKESGVSFVSVEETILERPSLEAAEVVVSGGRGLGSQENFALIEDLADTLNAAVGASRAAVDAGFVPNDYQVGQTGKVVAPNLYIAVGISGAIQHIAGMKDSKVIVAINKDEDAPIFQVADYGLVGDLFKIVPELTKSIKGLKK